MDLYCVKCRARTTKNNRLAISGICARCGTKKIRFIKKSGCDIAAKLAKLPGTPWAEYPGAKRIPVYSYCGPGTRLDIRLDNQDNPNPGEEPINTIDEACRIHDIAYRSGDLQQRHLANVKLIHVLNYITDKTFKEKLASWLIKSAMKGKLMLGAGN